MKTILITGASAGIGRALAVRASRAGYAVYAVARNANTLATLAAQISDEGGTVAIEAIDISRPDNAHGVISGAISAFGGIDVLVNNAGFAGAGPLVDATDDDLIAQFGTHVIGPIALTREAAPYLALSHGHVFMLGSGVARVPVGGLGAYPASKAALRSATATLRRDLKPFEVAVTYVDPGAVDTAFMRRAGMAGAPENVLVSPELVARKIMAATVTRPRTINVAPLQSAAVAVAEFFPRVTDAFLDRNPSLVGGATQLPKVDRQPAIIMQSAQFALTTAKPVPQAIGLPPEPETSSEDAVILDQPGVDTRTDGVHSVPVSAIEGSADAQSPQPKQAETATASAPADEPGVAHDVHDLHEPVVAEPVVADATEPERVAAHDIVEDPIDTEIASPATWAKDDDMQTTLERPDIEYTIEATVAPPPEIEPELPDNEPIEPETDPIADPSGDPEPPSVDPMPAEGEPMPVEAEALHDENAAPPAMSSFEAALEPLSRRMEKAHFDPQFVRGLLKPGSTIDVADAAMQWAGMPNKHERALTSEVFFALAEWGFLTPRSDGRYRVTFSADDSPTL